MGSQHCCGDLWQHHFPVAILSHGFLVWPLVCSFHRISYNLQLFYSFALGFLSTSCIGRDTPESKAYILTSSTGLAQCSYCTHIYYENEG